jgi:Ion channel
MGRRMQDGESSSVRLFEESRAPPALLRRKQMTEIDTFQGHAFVVVVATIVVIACVFVHYEALSYLTGVLKHLHTRPRPRILLLIFAILLTHIAEIWIFGGAYFLLISTEGHGALVAPHPIGFLDCVYYSVVCFTTLGFGDVLPVGPLRFLTGMETLTGFVLITWSASFMFLEMQRFWKS